jgi:hypothetical protein
MRCATPIFGMASTANDQANRACPIMARRGSVAARIGQVATDGTLLTAGQSKRSKVATAGMAAGVGQSIDQMVSAAGTALVGAVVAAVDVAGAVARAPRAAMFARRRWRS